MFEFNRDNNTIIVNDKAITKANKDAKSLGYLPYELTKKLYDANCLIHTPISKIWYITSKGNITLKNSNTAISMDYEYFTIPVFSVISWLEEQGFIIEVYHDYGYKWRLSNADSFLESEYNMHFNDWYDSICDIANEYIENYLL